MKHINLSLLTGKVLFVCLLFLTTFTSLIASSESEVITTIILIDRQAELVDVDQFGEVLRRHVAVPDYFSSGRSHNSSLRRSLKKVKDYGQLKTDFSIPGSSELPNEMLQSFLVQSSELSREIDQCILLINDVKTEHLSKPSSVQDLHGHYGYASLKEEYVKGENTKRKSIKAPFLYYKKSTPNNKQRIRGQMRYQYGKSSFT